jgi:hypothetical protein
LIAEGERRSTFHRRCPARAIAHSQLEPVRPACGKRRLSLQRVGH